MHRGGMWKSRVLGEHSQLPPLSAVAWILGLQIRGTEISENAIFWNVSAVPPIRGAIAGRRIFCHLDG
jgi:hypothetical protein